MSVCNLFRSISDNKSSFYTFSEYTDDLPLVLASDGQKYVRPSQFICCKLNTSSSLTGLHGILQNYYENLCCCKRNPTDKNYKDYLLGGLLGGLDNFIDVEEKVIVKEISIKGTGSHDNMNYDEIVCYIEPQDRASYTLTLDDTDKISINNEDEYLQGYHGIEDRDTAATGDFNFCKCTITKDSDTVDSSEEYFDFNCIIVLYDVRDNKDEILYSNIPLGIYINNPNEGLIRKYYSSETIYDQGTSYSLRVSMRFANTLDSTNVDSQFNFSNTDAELLALLDRFNHTANKIDELGKSFKTYSAQINDAVNANVDAESIIITPGTDGDYFQTKIGVGVGNGIYTISGHPKVKSFQSQVEENGLATTDEVKAYIDNQNNWETWEEEDE